MVKIESDKEKYHTVGKVNSDSSSDLVFSRAYEESKKNPVDLPKSAKEYIDESGNVQRIETEYLFPSQSNPYFNFRLKSLGGNDYPALDEDANNNDLFSEISAIDLIEDKSRGASIYSPEDFLYLRDYDALKLNRLITLRRFAFPVVDDIFSQLQTEPDISRLLTYFDQETNKLSDIMKMSLGLSWKDLEAKSEKATMEGGSAISGIANTVMRFVDPKYGREAMLGENVINYDPQHDENRVYGPVDSISKTKIRDIGVNFDQTIELEFNFEMKSHNGVNQKAAFIDLLSNIILMCTNDAKFWGGARYWVGPRPSKYMNDLKRMDSDSWREFVNNGLTSLSNFTKSLKSGSSARDQLRSIADNAMNLALGNILDRLGRTGIPVMNSLLTGNPVGMWHLTIGNPLNPIMVIGDLIIDNAEISFGDELGFDDFPNEMKLKLSLTHAKPRGRAEIENMFNCGKGRTYLKPEDVIRDNKTSYNMPGMLEPLEFNNDFGRFSKSDIERNKHELWSFLEDK